MSEPVLPFELQEAVIDVIPDADYIVFTATLRSCALTCYAWLRPSRRRLYNRVELNRPRLAQLDKLVETIDTSRDVSSAIRTVELRLGRDKKVVSDLPEATLFALAGKLPRITSLSVYGAKICSSPVRPPLLAGFPTLTTFEMGKVTFTSYVTFQRMLAAAPTLRRLFADITWESTRNLPRISANRLRCPPLTHLVWYEHSSSVSAFYHFFVILNAVRVTVHLRTASRSRTSSSVLMLAYRSSTSASSSPTISSTRFGLITPYLLVRCSVFAADLRETHISHLLAQHDPDFDFDLSGLPNLSTLQLRLSVFSARLASWTDVTTLVRSFVRVTAFLLAGVHTPRLRTIRFCFDFEDTALLVPFVHISTRYTAHSGSCKDPLVHLLFALEIVSPELEPVLISAARHRRLDLVLQFRNQASLLGRRLSERLHKFVICLRSKMKDLYPKLHKGGLLKVRFISDNGALFIPWPLTVIAATDHLQTYRAQVAGRIVSGWMMAKGVSEPSRGRTITFDR